MRAHTTTTKSAFILVLAVAIIAVWAAPAWATFPGEDGRIAFQGQGSTHEHEIFSARPDGTDIRRLTSTESSWSSLPDWSPDGERIAFDSGRAATPDHPVKELTYVMNADGSSVTQVAKGGRFQLTPSWSPDGDSVAITAEWGNYPALAGIWIIPVSDPDGVAREKARRVTTFPGAGAGREIDRFDYEPQFSPDGSSIVFTRYKAPRLSAIYRGRTASAIYRVGIDGGGLERLTPWRLDASKPDWSPDGQRIAFDSGFGYWDVVGRWPSAPAARSTSGKGNIHVMRADGSERTRLTDREPVGRGRAGFYGLRRLRGASNPVWSPSGTQIMYTRFFPEKRELVAMNPDGSGKHVVVGGRFGKRFLPNRVDWGTHP
jgi:Tol biopolymer transport system component